MAIPIDVTLNNLGRAEQVVQARIEKVAPFDGDFGPSKIHITILNVLKGSKLATGETIWVQVTTWRTKPPPGDYYCALSSLKKGALIELFLTEKIIGGFKAIAYPIQTLSDTPEYLKILSARVTPLKLPRGFFRRIKKWLSEI